MTTTYLSKKIDCHKGLALAFTIGAIRVYGGGSQSVNPDPKALLINLARNQPVVRVTDFPGTNVMRFSQPVVDIRWEDFTVPDLQADFWKCLLYDIQNAGLDVNVMCMGGHGRTGTALAILAALSGAVPRGKCPVGFIRKGYCKSAVESRSQLEYVEEMTGRRVTAEVTPRYVGYKHDPDEEWIQKLLKGGK